MIKEAIAQLVKRNDLTAETMGEVMEEIMTNQATDAQKASFLTALAMKGETIDEITAAAKVMRAHCERFLNDMDVLEIVGTGGDGSNTFNISTLSSFVASAAGIPVAKHGNRAASSKCGTADCLEALGVFNNETIYNNELFPDPEGPNKDTNSPLCMSKDTFEKIVLLVLPSIYSKSIFFTPSIPLPHFYNGYQIFFCKF